MDKQLDRFERLALRAREAQSAIPGVAAGVFNRIVQADPDPPRWPILLVTAGYALVIGLALFGVFTAYGQITHPLLQVFNSVAQAAF